MGNLVPRVPLLLGPCGERGGRVGEGPWERGCAMGSKHFCFVERGVQNVLLLLFGMNLASPPPPPPASEQLMILILRQ